MEDDMQAIYRFSTCAYVICCFLMFSYLQLKSLPAAFFLFGLTNNVLYVVILSAAVDLAPSTPKGLIAFVNIFPALLAKLVWPYLLKGSIRYAKRTTSCCLMSSLGMLIVAFSSSLSPRLIGIALASFSSGLGELTFLQLSTVYPQQDGGKSVGAFASGTGAAGLVGALLWWILRNLGVKLGVGISAILPIIIPLTYFYLLPPVDTSRRSEYAPVPSAEDLPGEHVTQEISPPIKHVSLSFADKWQLVRPLLLPFMLPLFCVYTLEYTINSGICPTLLYPLPSPAEHPFLSKIFRDLKDYYPTWQLTYQTAVFLSRSSISLGLPPLPIPLLPVPAYIQAAVLALLSYESARGLFSPDSETTSMALVFCLIAVEGLCGGLAYVNVFFHVNQQSQDESYDSERAQQEREFKIGSLGFSDSLGILTASLISIPTELGLCSVQQSRGKNLCKQL